MATAGAVIGQIEAAFGSADYPGDAWLVGSSEGCEPTEEAGAFAGRTRWQDIEPAFLDAHYAALSFFSEAGFRFFLPAFLVADLRDQLMTADPLGHLTTGFHEGSAVIPVGEQSFIRPYGGSTFVNPRRYGAMTMNDYARFRLSIFAREEAAAIASYLEYKRDAETIEALRRPIVAALDTYWRERAATAPSAASLQAHLAKETAFAEALRRQRENDDPTRPA
jgi:hypothetical protein